MALDPNALSGIAQVFAGMLQGRTQAQQLNQQREQLEREMVLREKTQTAAEAAQTFQRNMLEYNAAVEHIRDMRDRGLISEADAARSIADIAKKFNFGDFPMPTPGAGGFTGEDVFGAPVPRPSTFEQRTPGMASLRERTAGIIPLFAGALARKAQQYRTELGEQEAFLNAPEDQELKEIAAVTKPFPGENREAYWKRVVDIHKDAMQHGVASGSFEARDWLIRKKMFGGKSLSELDPVELEQYKAVMSGGDISQGGQTALIKSAADIKKLEAKNEIELGMPARWFSSLTGRDESEFIHLTPREQDPFISIASGKPVFSLSQLNWEKINLMGAQQQLYEVRRELLQNELLLKQKYGEAEYKKKLEFLDARIQETRNMMRIREQSYQLRKLDYELRKQIYSDQAEVKSSKSFTDWQLKMNGIMDRAEGRKAAAMARLVRNDTLRGTVMLKEGSKEYNVIIQGAAAAQAEIDAIKDTMSWAEQAPTPRNEAEAQQLISKLNKHFLSQLNARSGSGK